MMHGNDEQMRQCFPNV